MVNVNLFSSHNELCNRGLFCFVTPWMRSE